MTTAPFRSLEDLHRYTQELGSRRVDDDPVVRKLHTAKQATWLFLLTCAVLFYYLIDKMQEAILMLI
jgi:hypothetical protein